MMPFFCFRDGGVVDMEKRSLDIEVEIKQDHNANFEDDLFLGAEGMTMSLLCTLLHI